MTKTDQRKNEICSEVIILNNLVLTVEETAKILKVSREVIYVLVKTKDFPAVKIGREWRIVAQGLSEWLRQQCIGKSEYP